MGPRTVFAAATTGEARALVIERAAIDRLIVEPAIDPIMDPNGALPGRDVASRIRFA